MRTPKSCKVRLYIRIRRTDGKYAYADPAWSRNRTLREGYALVGNRTDTHPEGIYYLRYLRGKKRVWQSVGPAADAALTALRNKEHDLQAVALGRVALEPIDEKAPSVTVAEAIDSYTARRASISTRLSREIASIGRLSISEIRLDTVRKCLDLRAMDTV